MGFGNWVDGLRLLLEISENKWRSILWRNIYIYTYTCIYKYGVIRTILT